jgi:inner membrane protein
MNPPVWGDWITILMLAGGVLLIASELLHASFTTLFLGAGAVIVAVLRGLGIIDGWMFSVLLWAATTLGLTFSLRPFARRYLPGETKYDPSDEDRDAYGTLVAVVETINEGDEKGRIRFQGTTWSATSIDGTLPAGSTARLISRDKLAWIVERVEDDEIRRLEAPKSERT